MSETQYRSKTVDRTFYLLQVVRDAGQPLTLTEVSETAGLNTSTAFRLLKTLESSGHLRRDVKKRYIAISGGGGEIGLTRGLAMLDAIAAEPGGVASAASLAETFQIDGPQVERALKKMAAAGVVRERPDLNGWTISSAMMRFLRPLMNDQMLERYVRPLMEELGRRYGETVSWFVAHDWEQVVVDVVPSPNAIRYVLETGERQPTYLGAGGKAYLAAMPEADVRAFIASLNLIPLTRFSPDKPSLLSELKTIRARGYATSLGERVEGAAAVAVAVPGTDETPAGVLSIMMPQFRVDAEAITEMGQTLRSEVARLVPRVAKEATR